GGARAAPAAADEGDLERVAAGGVDERHGHARQRRRGGGGRGVVDELAARGALLLSGHDETPVRVDSVKPLGNRLPGCRCYATRRRLDLGTAIVVGGPRDCKTFPATLTVGVDEHTPLVI